MSREIKESDWKVFRDLHKVAIDRYYVRAISELQPLVLGNAGTSRERYLKLLKLTDERREELGGLFDDFRRSTALFQMAMICRQNLLTAEECPASAPKPARRWRRI
jgi:hypothetical protein